MFFTKSLRIKAIIAALVPAVLVLVVVAIIGLYVYEHLARDIVEQRDTELATITAARLSEGLTPHSQILQNLAADNEVQSMEPARLLRALEKAQLQLFVFDSVLVYDHQGVAVSSDPFAFERRGTDFPVPSEFEKVRSTLQPHFSDVFKDSHSGQDAILSAVPVVASSSEFKGVVAGISTLSSLLSNATYSAVLEITAGGEGFAFLVDGNGRVIYHRDNSQLGRDLSNTTPVRQVSRGEADAVITKDSAGEKVISGFAPVPGTSWGIITQEEWGNVVGPIQNYGKLLVVLLALGGVLSGSLIFFAIGRVLKPIKDLTQGAQRIADGDFDHAIEARTGDELEGLAERFNAMAAALKGSYTELERRVEARTEELRLSEEQSRETHRLLSAVVEAAPVAIVTHDQNAHISTWSPGAEQIFGWTDEEVIGKDIPPFVPADKVEEYRSNLRRGLQGESRASFEARRQTKGGSLIDVGIWTAPLRDAQDQINGIMTIMADLTELKRTEEELRETHQILHAFIEAAPLALLTFGPDQRINMWSPGAEQIFGWTAEEVVGRDVPPFVPSGKEEEYKTNVQWVFDGGSRAGLETRRSRKDGSAIDVGIWTAPLRDLQQKVNGSMAIMVDVTQRKRTEEALSRYTDELARSNADLEQFAYLASHDLQEPLRMVSSYTQLLARRYKDKLDSDANEFISFAVDGATRMQDLINDLLAYSQVGSGSRPLEAVDCGTVFRRAVVNLSKAIDDSGAKVTSDHLPIVRGDEPQLTLLLQNLIANGIKFRGDPTPDVHLSAERRNGSWLFSVRDNGIGIEEEYSDRIFGIFQRLHTREQYQGTGVGLAICKRVVERHDGTIWVESKPGNGSVFRFTLPALKEGEA